MTQFDNNFIVEKLLLMNNLFVIANFCGSKEVQSFLAYGRSPQNTPPQVQQKDCITTKIEYVIEIERSDIKEEMFSQLNKKMNDLLTIHHNTDLLTRETLLNNTRLSLQRIIDSDVLFDPTETKVHECNYTVKILLNERVLKGANSHNRT